MLLGSSRLKGANKTETAEKKYALEDLPLTARQELAKRLEEIRQKDGDEAKRLLVQLISEVKPGQAAVMLESALLAAMPPAPRNVGEALVAAGAITESQLLEAQAAQSNLGGFLDRILVDMGFVKQDLIVLLLVKVCKIPHLSLLDYDISKDVLELVPPDFCLRHRVVPIDKLGRIITLAMVDPLDTQVIAEVRKHNLDLKIKPILCNWQHFEEVSAKYLRPAAAVMAKSDSWKPEQATECAEVVKADSVPMPGAFPGNFPH